MSVTAAKLIRNARGDLPEIQWKHYSNYAVDKVFGNVLYELWYSYEDGNIYAEASALREAQAVEAVCPDAYVWVKTGDYIHGKTHHRFHTYDPNYRRIAIPTISWRARHDELDRIEKRWRDGCKARANGMKYYEEKS
jgi:hypothetical protein